MCSDAIPFIAGVFNHYWPEIAERSRELSDDQIEVALRDPVHAVKAAGFPCNAFGAGTKVAALEKFGLPGLKKIYDVNESIVGSTLKAEIRDWLKDARAFRPSDVSAYVYGLCYFYDQDNYILENVNLRTPVFAQYQTPGQAILRVYDELVLFGGDCFGADGKKWDAHYPLVVAQFVCWWRAQGDAERLEKFEKYYRRMYNGWTLVYDRLVNLVGQPSGHMNTTTDNCLCHVFMFAYHAWRCGLTPQFLYDNVRFFCSGDDLIWSTKSPLFRPKTLVKTYESFGMDLEFESWDPSPAHHLSFVGVTPCTSVLRGHSYQLYVGRIERLKASYEFYERNAKLKSRLSKKVSILQLMFPVEELFEEYKKRLYYDIDVAIANGELLLNDADVAGWKASLNFSTLLNQYLEFEKADRNNIPFKEDGDGFLESNDGFASQPESSTICTYGCRPYDASNSQ